MSTRPSQFDWAVTTTQLTTALTTYSSSFNYLLPQNSTLYSNLTSGSQWTADQLKYTVSAGANPANSVPAPSIDRLPLNISGRQVMLYAPNGNIGSLATPETFTFRSDNASNLTDVQKALLASAGPGQLTVSSTDVPGTNGQIKQYTVSIAQQSLLIISPLGPVSALAKSQIYLGSASDLKLGGIPLATFPGGARGASNVVSAAQAQVEGFRSARFGMSEAEVKAAIAKDFGIKGDALRDQSNPGERTKVLVAKVPDLLPGGGIAEASYVIGYQSKKLIQVSLSRSKATDDKLTPEQLFSNSSVLRAHFMNEGFKPDSIATNMPINGGILMFRGSDAKDRTVMMILQGTLAQGEGNQRVLTPTALLLFYIADAKTPDVYRLPPGSF